MAFVSPPPSLLPEKWCWVNVPKSRKSFWYREGEWALALSSMYPAHAQGLTWPTDHGDLLTPCYLWEAVVTHIKTLTETIVKGMI